MIESPSLADEEAMEVEEAEDEDGEGQVGRAAPEERVVRPVTNPKERRKLFRKFVNEFKKKVRKLRAKIGVEASMVLMSTHPDTKKSQVVEFHSTPALRGLSDVTDWPEAAKLCYELALKREEVARYIGGAAKPAIFSQLALDSQRRLVKWLLKQAIYDQKGVAPFKKTSAARMKETFPWYPTSVEWQSPATMPPNDLETMFPALAGALKNRGPALLLRWDRDFPLKEPEAHDSAKALLRAQFFGDAVEPVHDVAAMPFVEADGRQYLPPAATNAQILALLNADVERKTRKNNEHVKIHGLKLTLASLYNMVQSHGGWAEVSKDNGSMDSCLQALGMLTSTGPARKALKNAWMKYLQPYTLPAAPVAAPQASGFQAMLHQSPQPPAESVSAGVRAMEELDGLRQDLNVEPQRPASNP